MLAVTEVNRCRYCSFVHTRAALQSGLTPGQIEQILKHEVQGCPPDELPAVLYAQHWAETDGRPDEEVRGQLVRQFGSGKVAKIEMALGMMRAANLTGNSLDYLLFRISFGRLGN